MISVSGRKLLNFYSCSEHIFRALFMTYLRMPASSLSGLVSSCHSDRNCIFRMWHLFDAALQNASYTQVLTFNSHEPFLFLIYNVASASWHDRLITARILLKKKYPLSLIDGQRDWGLFLLFFSSRNLLPFGNQLVSSPFLNLHLVNIIYYSHA